MPARSKEHVTRTLVDASRGNQAAAEELVPVIYAELRELAARHLRGERADHTLQATSLVNEAYLKLVDRDNIHANGTTHFKAIAGRAMAQVLIDHARSRAAAKRGGNWQRICLEEGATLLGMDVADASDVTEALQRLAEIDARKAQVVELRFLGGLENREVADLLEVSLSTVEADWRAARAWLRRELAVS